MTDRQESESILSVRDTYEVLVTGISELIEEQRRQAVRSVNSILAVAYWEIGRRIVEFEQMGKERAEYGEAVLVKLARDLTARYGRGFSKTNIFQMRAFYLGWTIFQTPSGIFTAKAKSPTLSGESESIFSTPIAVSPIRFAVAFPLS